jgi:hypothetical protein
VNVKVTVPTPDGVREFAIGRPATRVYVDLVKFVSRLLTSGYEQAVRKMSSVIAAGGEVNDTMLVVYAIDQLAAEDIERLAALLLHFSDEDEGLRFVKEAGFDLAWFTDALAANLEQVDVSTIVKNLRRAASAVQGKVAEAKTKAKRSSK